jgi:DNA-binding MarR family transcriptional regulator
LRVTGPSLDNYREAADLRAALRAFLRRSEEISRRNGLTPRQYLLLLMVKGARDGSERSTITDLVDRLALTQSTVTELVQRAQDAELLVREPSASDGRVVYLRLTAKGERLVTAAFNELGPERQALLRLIRQD